jgi:hypothetical protein
LDFSPANFLPIELETRPPPALLPFYGEIGFGQSFVCRPGTFFALTFGLAFSHESFNFVPMIAAVTQSAHSFSLNNLPFGWFDAAFVIVLGFGLFCGRKNGMTKEIIPMFQWIATVIAAGLGCEMLGQVIVNISGLDKLSAYILGYVALALVVFLLFILVKKTFMPRLTGSNFFGGAEYYLGMISGLIRYSCLLLFALALLNAPYYTSQEIAAHKAYVARWYGGGLQGYSGNYFPTVQSVQESVFKGSLIGPFIKDYLGPLLINSVPPEADKKAPPQKKPMIHIGN